MLNDLRTEITTLKSECIVDASKQHVRVDHENYTIELLDKYHREFYKPTETGLKFHSCDDRVRVIRGHVGSGKTTSMCAEIIFRACKMPPCNDGIRRSRWAVIRNTYGDLIKTTIHTWNQWWRYLGKQIIRQTPSYQIIHTFNDGDGIVEMELLPIALDNVVDVTKHLKSLEVTGVFLNELSELHRLVLDFFSGGRLPRFPRKIDFPQEVQDRQRMYWSGIFGDTNPPDQDSWIYELFEKERPIEYTMMAQPPAVLKAEAGYIINPKAENICNIPNGAEEYIKMTYGKSENFIRVYLMGEYGTISEEKKVYNNYNDNFHSADSLEIYKEEPLIIGADLGTVAPAIAIAQYVAGQLRVIKEFCGAFTTISDLVKHVVMPWLVLNCKNMDIAAVIHDPADTYDGAQQLREFFGEAVIPGITNNIELRIDAVSQWLNCMVMGNPAFLVDRGGCIKLRQGFNGKYYYKRLRVIGEEKYQDKPNKNHPFSDIHDALQYICSYVNKELSLDDIEEANYASEYELKLKRRQYANKITGY